MAAGTGRMYGAVMGHIVGDALGVPVEFVPREKLAEAPVAGMLEYGTHHVPRGTWSDDSSMMLCTLESLTETQRVDLPDLMERFSRWAKEGHLTPYGRAFGVGRTVLRALGKYWRGTEPAACGCTAERDSGNGSLMRILPVALFLAMRVPGLAEAEKLDVIHSVSALTHAHPCPRTACGIFSVVLWELLGTPSCGAIHAGLEKAAAFYTGRPGAEAYNRLFSPDFAGLPAAQIKSSGYAPDTLEAAIWCVLTSDSYRSCVLKAVNLGGDADTIAAVAGSLAGALYGRASIPPEWVEVLARRDEIDAMCGRFFA